MDFINRTKELNTLNEEYEKNRFSFIVIYGRRRVGKTRLISEFIKNKDAFYFLADIQTEKLNIQRFCKSASRILKDEFMTKIDFNDWGTIFEYIFKHWNKNKKLIIVVDEFQYLAQINAATASIFQRIIDETLQNQNCMLILCGSIISLMYKHT
ncbi:ATPase, partial [Candidatus Magnetomorum sp. HK-1]